MPHCSPVQPHAHQRLVSTSSWRSPLLPASAQWELFSVSVAQPQPAHPAMFRFLYFCVHPAIFRFLYFCVRPAIFRFLYFCISMLILPYLDFCIFCISVLILPNLDFSTFLCFCTCGVQSGRSSVSSLGRPREIFSPLKHFNEVFIQTTRFKSKSFQDLSITVRVPSTPIQCVSVT